MTCNQQTEDVGCIEKYTTNSFRVQGSRCRLNLKGPKYHDLKNVNSPEKVSAAPTRPYPEPCCKKMFGYSKPSCLRKLIVLLFTNAYTAARPGNATQALFFHRLRLNCWRMGWAGKLHTKLQKQRTAHTSLHTSLPAAPHTSLPPRSPHTSLPTFYSIPHSLSPYLTPYLIPYLTPYLIAGALSKNTVWK